jgi:hypothetical protein
MTTAVVVGTGFGCITQPYHQPLPPPGADRATAVTRSSLFAGDVDDHSAFDDHAVLGIRGVDHL